MGICVKSDEIEDLDEEAIRCQHKVIEILRKLTDRPTKSQKPEKIINFHKWSLYNEALFLQPTKEVIKEDSVYPLHCALQLEERDDVAEDMVLHLQELRTLAIS